MADAPHEQWSEVGLLLATSVALTRERLIDGLVHRGFQLVVDNSDGGTSSALLRRHDLSIELDGGFPFLPPRVQSLQPEVMSWHRDAEGYLCLYTPLDNEHRPWLDVDALLERVARWRRENARGWPDDPPALDLEPYLRLARDPRFVVFKDLEPYCDKFVHFALEGRQLRLTRAGRVPRRRRRHQLGGFVLDVGELRQPPTTWATLLEGHPARETVRAAIESGRLDVLLIRYERKSQRATAAVTFAPIDSAPKSPRARGRNRHPKSVPAESTRQAYVAYSGAADDLAMRLRSGSDASHLGGRGVCVVGAGALGSFVCDGLVRAGIGRLTIRDFDVLRPGNMTRHLIGHLGYAGLNKAAALKLYFDSIAYNRADIVAEPRGLMTVADALALIESHDLVIDASADGAATGVLRAAAEASRARIVVACLQNEGRSLRIENVPPFAGVPPLAPTPLRPSTGAEVFDGGCGLPLSPTPPHAVMEAAAMAVRHATALLRGEAVSAAGEVREL